MPTRLTQDQFIKKAKAVHGNKYDYSNTVYNGIMSNVTIICPTHGVFTQLASNHYQSGCKKCGDSIHSGGRQRYSTESFIQKAKTIYGDRYDYSLVEYKHSQKKIKIICPDHGVFETLPSHFLCFERGCPECSIRSGLVTRKDNYAKLFVKNAHRVHGDKYDYSLVEYTGNEHPVKIICKEHGEFIQIPRTHLKGGQCPKCPSTSGKMFRDTETFIRDAKVLHGDKYDYSNTIFSGSRRRVKIVCQTHGEFEQLAWAHLRGDGCKHCRPFQNKPKTTDKFIRQAKESHGDKFDYSQTEYISCYKKVSVVCPTHGKFEVMPTDHINGQGCKLCKKEFRTSAKHKATEC